MDLLNYWCRGDEAPAPAGKRRRNKTEKNMSTQIANSVAVISKFDRSIKLDLVRFGSKQFGHVCAQTGKKLFITYGTRLDAAVGIASRYFTCQSHADCAFVNPKSVATVGGLEFALDFLISAGFVRIEKIDGVRTAVAVQLHEVAKNS